LSVMGPGLELSYITLARKKLSLFESVETINDSQNHLYPWANYSLKGGY